ncbi:hypothetical protein [Hymenobacter lapidiphilus]|uniref:hypothetical protein n=1 Tax=Hymenobacter sp. CCM 8763 TaxID=2303334 RepID=UPI00167D524E|nr:hypothetical protein [Hymenobacter sp. CCM 8763]
MSVPGQKLALELLKTPHYSQALRLGCFLGNVLGLRVFGYDRTKQEELLQEIE